jgi:hypothetical protein
VYYPISMIEAKFIQAELCCTGSTWNDTDPESSCESYYGQSCGVYGGYGEISSGCCEDTDGLLSVLYCDSTGTFMTWERCHGPATCVRHTGISGGLGDIGYYAECEFLG